MCVGKWGRGVAMGGLRDGGVDGWTLCSKCLTVKRREVEVKIECVHASVSKRCDAE